MFLTIDQATNRIVRLTVNPEFKDGSLKQLAEAGTLKICFRYRGTLGVFKFPAETLLPKPEQTIYFDGYLRSLAKPRLRSVVKTLGARQVIDQLTPIAVEIASYVFPDQIPTIQPPHYWGRVRDEIRHAGGIQPALMESSQIPENEWLIDEADLDIYLQPFRSLVPAGAVAAQTTTTTSEPAPAQTPETPIPAESATHRRARYLDLFEAEEKNGKRGALARIAKREGVDSSNMNKDIKIARTARNKKTQEGSGTYGQLVIGGKRQH